MSAPAIVSISPSAGQTDVVLGSKIEVTFDQAIDPRTVSEATVSLMGPGQTGLINPSQLLQNDPSVITGREYIPGKFTFPAPNKFVFDPSRPLRPNVRYTFLIAGGGGAIVKDSVKNLDGEAMVKSLQTSFNTGTLQVDTAPPASPLPFTDPAVPEWMRPKLNPIDIIVRPRAAVGNRLDQVIELIFPAPVDPDSFSMEDLDISVEPIVGDPLLTVPEGLTSSALIDGNKILITISGWVQ